jgi:anti-anti-sigma factor
VVWVGRIAVVTLPAEVDLSNAGQVDRAVAAVVAQDASLVIADMTATTFCDSAGVTALVRALRQANASGAGLRVAAGAPAVARVLAITGVDRLVEIYPSVAAALAGPENEPAGNQPAGQGDTARPGTAGQAGPGERTPRPG